MSFWRIRFRMLVGGARLTPLFVPTHMLLGMIDDTLNTWSYTVISQVVLCSSLTPSNSQPFVGSTLRALFGKPFKSSRGMQFGTLAVGGYMQSRPPPRASTLRYKLSFFFPADLPCILLCLP